MEARFAHLSKIPDFQLMQAIGTKTIFEVKGEMVQ